jgi:hypothetical protein
LEFHTPDGKIKIGKIKSIRNTENDCSNVSDKKDLILIDHFSGISIKSNVYMMAPFSNEKGANINI